METENPSHAYAESVRSEIVMSTRRFLTDLPPAIALPATLYHLRVLTYDLLHLSPFVVSVKVVPGASRTRILGEWDGRARMAVATPPEKGKANKALIAFLAKLLSVRKSDVTVVTGQSASVKTIRIKRVSADTVRAALQAAQP